MSSQESPIIFLIAMFVGSLALITCGHDDSKRRRSPYACVAVPNVTDEQEEALKTIDALLREIELDAMMLQGDICHDGVWNVSGSELSLAERQELLEEIGWNRALIESAFGLCDARLHDACDHAFRIDWQDILTSEAEGVRSCFDVVRVARVLEAHATVLVTKDSAAFPHKLHAWLQGHSHLPNDVWQLGYAYTSTDPCGVRVIHAIAELKRYQYW